MILTGKAKDDFLKTKVGNELSLFESMLPIYKHALIIDWFDSVGIIINIINQDLQNWFYYEIKTLEVINGFNLFRTRQEATEQAIIKANEIYNNLNK